MALMSPSYDRLEAGWPPLKQRRRLVWKKFALGAGVFLLLVWLFVPRHIASDRGWGADSTFEMEDTATPKMSAALDNPPMRPSTKTLDSAPPMPPPNHADEDIPHPHSFESDPNPSKTTYCTSPHSSVSRLVQYALMIDAGSTGSRIHIYKFNNCGPSPAYEYEVFKKTEPGLSSFALKGRPAAEAAASLDVLMEEAMRVVPKELRKCTPVAVKATAGLRLLPGSQADDILEAVVEHLRDAYPFALAGNDSEAVSIMDGADEGVYAWVTANYLLGTLRADTGIPPKTPPTYAVLDLGGASTQIVFAPTGGAPLLEGEHKYELEFSGRKRILYQHSYLGYGLMRGRAGVHRLVDFMAPPQAAADALVSNVCLARGTRQAVELVEPNGGKKTVTMSGGDVGSFTACSRVVSLVLAKDAVCTVRPCAFGGVYQPALGEAFPADAGRVLLLSYFYDRVAPLMPALEDGGMPLQLTTTVDMIKELAEKVCAGRGAWLERWGTQTRLMADLDAEPEWCLDLTFMYELLRTGYEFEGDREVMLGRKITGTELGWCLGAGIKLVGGVDVQCRV